MTLQRKIILRVYALTILMIIAMSAAYYYIFTKDVRERSQQNLNMAFEQVFDDLYTRTTAVQSKIEHFTSSSLVNPLYMIQMFQDQQSASDQPISVWHVKKIMTYLAAMSAKTEEFATLSDAAQIVIYSRKGLMLVTTQQTDNEFETMAYLAEVNPDGVIPMEPGDRWYAMLQSLDEIPYKPLPRELPLRYPTSLPEEMRMTFGTVNNLLTLRFLAPIINRGELHGLCEIHLAIRQQDVERYAKLSGTAVNIFVGSAFSAGTLPDYDTFSPDRSDMQAAPDISSLLSTHPDIAVSEMKAGGRSYYQGSVMVGRPEGTSGAITVLYPRALEEQQKRRFFLIVLAIGVVFSLLAIAEALGLSRAIMKPISRLMAGIQEMEQGNLDVQVQVKTGDELQTLAETFNTMGRELKENMERREEQERLKKEMELAQQIQTSLLPKEVRHDEIEIEAKMLPADEVGGDFYDVLFGKGRELWLAIGDVSGHGVTPGLIMMMAQTSHTTIIRHLDYTPKDVVSIVNTILYHNVRQRLGETHFMTFSTIKYLGNGDFQYAGAHLDMIVYRKTQQQCELMDTRGVWLNFLEDIEYATENNNFHLDIGDTLILYTDGLTEAFDDNDTMLDIHGFLDIIKTHAEKPTADMRDGILQDVLTWCQNVRKDDMTLLVARRKK